MPVSCELLNEYFMQATQPAQLDPRKVRIQLGIMIIIILIGGVLGAYMIQAGVLPEQYTLEIGEVAVGLDVLEGYGEIRVFAMDLAAPRFILAHPTQNVLFVSERGGGRVLALQDADQDGVADTPTLVQDHLTNPSGMAFYDNALYVAQTGQILRLTLNDDFTATDSEVIINNLPVGKTTSEVDSNQYALLIHDGELYVSVGASCASCQEQDSRRAALLVYDLDGSNERVFARGLYQTLALTVNPINGAIWAGIQGRPQFESQDIPESLYQLQNGDDAGWPRCYAGTIPDPEYGDTACENALQPLLTFIPQSNITSTLFSQDGSALIALHGGVQMNEEQSPFGVYRLEIDSQTGDILSSTPQAFVSGFRRSEEPGDHIGRPFALAQTPDGTIYISDDAAGAIYILRNTGS